MVLWSDILKKKNKSSIKFISQKNHAYQQLILGVESKQYAILNKQGIIHRWLQVMQFFLQISDGLSGTTCVLIYVNDILIMGKNAHTLIEDLRG